MITRQSVWHASGATAVQSLEAAQALCKETATEEVWIIGGAQIYAQALPLAQRAVVTELELELQGDAFTPELDGAWIELARERQQSKNGVSFSWVTYLNSTWTTRLGP